MSFAILFEVKLYPIKNIADMKYYSSSVSVRSFLMTLYLIQPINFILFYRLRTKNLITLDPIDYSLSLLVRRTVLKTVSLMLLFVTFKLNVFLI